MGELFPPLTGFVARLLTSLAHFPPLMFGAMYLLKKRQQQQISEWKAVGAMRGVENVYAAAEYLYERRKVNIRCARPIVSPSHESDVLPS